MGDLRGSPPRMEAPFPDQSSPFVEWGTRCHEIAESCLLKDAPGTYNTLLHAPEDEQDRREKAAVAQTYVDYVAELRAQTDGLLLVEARVDISA